MKKTAKWAWYGAVLAVAWLACSAPPVTGWKIVLVVDSANNSVVGLRKAAKLAVEKFNAATDIQGRPLELVVLDLSQTQIRTETDLQNYLQDARARSATVGFVMGAPSPAKRQFQQIPGAKDLVVVGSWPFPAGQGAAWLNIARPPHESNKYLLEYIVEQRKLDSVYVVYDAANRGIAEDFLSHAAGLEVISLQYAEEGRPNYGQGRIRSLSDLLRAQRRILLQNSPKRGIVLFLGQANAAESNRYLARSPYRYLLDRFDIILNGVGLQLPSLPSPQSPRYFVLQREDNGQKYDEFQRQYRERYHLRVRWATAELYDATTLLARAAKAAIESSGSIYQNLLETQFEGATGCWTFDRQGQLLGQYVSFEWAEGIPPPNSCQN